MGALRSQRRVVWQLADQLREEVTRLATQSSLESSAALRSQIVDATGAACRHIDGALMADRARDCGRFVRLARGAIQDVREGCRVAVRKQMLTDRDLKEARELMSQLYSALSALLSDQSKAD